MRQVSAVANYAGIIGVFFHCLGITRFCVISLVVVVVIVVRVVKVEVKHIAVAVSAKSAASFNISDLSFGLY